MRELVRGQRAHVLGFGDEGLQVEIEHLPMVRPRASVEDDVAVVEGPIHGVGVIVEVVDEDGDAGVVVDSGVGSSAIGLGERRVDARVESRPQLSHQGVVEQSLVVHVDDAVLARVSGRRLDLRVGGCTPIEGPEGTDRPDYRLRCAQRSLGARLSLRVSLRGDLRLSGGGCDDPKHGGRESEGRPDNYSPRPALGTQGSHDGGTRGRAIAAEVLGMTDSRRRSVGVQVTQPDRVSGTG